LEATIDGQIQGHVIEWDSRVSVTVVLASGGYPGKYETGKRISGLADAAKLEGVEVFHAGTKKLDGETVTSGGRVLAVTALGQTIKDARGRAYEAISRIDFDGCYYRRDIALSAASS
ncbi:MAG TPA: phosphoribosylglycinamide synthetase C domain-containing protein, partial [Chthoniobacterales bacterium]|nr:phosphoribosylglycinamide synthetase C domain-containing protein [Chthoniobacterales bacterium]